MVASLLVQRLSIVPPLTIRFSILGNWSWGVPGLSERCRLFVTISIFLFKRQVKLIVPTFQWPLSRPWRFYIRNRPSRNLTRSIVYSVTIVRFTESLLSGLSLSQHSPLLVQVVNMLVE